MAVGQGPQAVIPVVWMTPVEGTPARGYWDQSIVEDLLSGRLWRPARSYEFAHREVGAGESTGGGGGVVVLPSTRADPDDVSRRIAGMDWVVLICTSDEGSAFVWEDVEHPRLSVWVQNPDPHRPPPHGLPVGYAPGTLTEAARHVGMPKALDWAFLGQITHRRRQHAAAGMAKMDGGRYLATEGFGQGVPHDEYIAALSEAKVVPCPGGPLTPDSFRVWEALECGAVPLLDAESASTNRKGYWGALLGDDLPGPEVGTWADLRRITADVLERWPRSGVESCAWWHGYRRQTAYELRDDIAALSGALPEPQGVEDLVTVLVLTSPMPSHPSTEILDQTLASLVEVGLGGCETFVLADGVREPQEHRRKEYEASLWSTVRTCGERVLPLVFGDHQHQARMTRRALELVRTPLVLFVEGDCPIHGPIDWGALAPVLLSGEANLVRFHHEEAVHPEHRHLMVGDGPTQVQGVNMWACAQWSQRPHLARSNYYRHILDAYFSPEERWMIEDRMHSVLGCAWRDHGFAGWERHRVWLYHEAGPVGIRRSLHLDGRGDDPKWVDR